MALQVEKRLFTIEDYYRMAETGILRRDDRVELIRGEIVRMAPIGIPHASRVDILTVEFVRAVGDDAIVRVQNPIRLEAQNSEPEPDISLLRPKRDYYASAHPTPVDVLLVVEVADSSLSYDRNVKMPLYAEAGIPEVWIMALEEECVERYSGLDGGEYRDVRRFYPGESIAPALLPNARLDVGRLFGVEYAAN